MWSAIRVLPGNAAVQWLNRSTEVLLTRIRLLAKELTIYLSVRFAELPSV